VGFLDVLVSCHRDFPIGPGRLQTRTLKINQGPVTVDQLVMFVGLCLLDFLGLGILSCKEPMPGNFHDPSHFRAAVWLREPSA
jgi:hypothetical protein